MWNSHGGYLEAAPSLQKGGKKNVLYIIEQSGTLSHAPSLQKGGKKNVLYIIEQSSTLSHPDAGTPLNMTVNNILLEPTQ